MATCFKCNKEIGFLGKKYYIYPAKEKGSLEITPEKVVCKDCISLNYVENSEKTILQKSTQLVLLLQNKKYEEALKLVESGFDKTSETDWYSKGNILGNLNKNEESIQCYDEALFLDTRYTKAWYRKGLKLLAMGRLEATACFENVITLENEPKKMWWSKAAVFCLLLCYLHTKKSLENNGQTQSEMYKLAINRINYFKSVFNDRILLT